MDRKSPPLDPYAEAISAAAVHVLERAVAADEAEARARPKSRVPRAMAAGTVLLLLVAWNVRALVRPPTLAAFPQERVHLAWFVADAAEAVEDFLSAEQRLPSPDELSDVLGDDIRYHTVGDRYLVVAESEGILLEYDSAEPIEDWLSAHRAADQGPIP